MPNIKLQSSDGEVFEVDVEIAKVILRNLLGDLDTDEDEKEIVPLPEVNSVILRKIIQWATYHKDDPPPPEDDENKVKHANDIMLSSWDADFVKVDHETLFGLILAANYLNIRGLLNVMCKRVCDLIEGKTPEEIRKIFNIINQFEASPETDRTC